MTDQAKDLGRWIGKALTSPISELNTILRPIVETMGKMTQPISWVVTLEAEMDLHKMALGISSQAEIFLVIGEMLVEVTEEMLAEVAMAIVVEMQVVETLVEIEVLVAETKAKTWIHQVVMAFPSVVIDQLV